MLPRHRLRAPAARGLATALLLALTLLGVLVPLLARIAPASAQIINNQPNQWYGSLVDCLQNGPNGRLVTTCFGGAWSRGAYGAGSDQFDANPTDGAIVTFYDEKPDQTNSNPGEDSAHREPAALAEAGSVYGLAYRSQNSALFASSYVKRATRFGNGGSAAVYVLDPTRANTTALAFTVPGADAGVPTNNERERFDAGVVNLVGQAGLGDIALTPDESRLLVVNLSTRALHQFGATAPYTQLRADALPVSVAGCPGGTGDFRPFGVRARRTATNPLEIYVAFVCSGATRATFSDVRAGALRSTDGGASWALAALTPLDADHNDPAATSRREERWTYWRDGDANCSASNAYAAMCPQPLAASLDFLFDGRLLIGLRDRFGDMGMPVQRNEGGTTYPLGRGTGDALVLAPTGPTTWGGAVLAANGNEYLHEETYGANLHPEPLWGAVAVLPGTSGGGVGQQIVSTYKAPYSVLSGGVGWFDYTGATEGAPLTGLEEIYDDQMAATFGKTSGLGDLEPLCAWAQIGDRVWLDQNNNGAQDSGEPGQGGVRLRISQNGRSVDVTTNAAGNWTVYVNPFATFRIQVVSGLPAGYGYTSANRSDDTLDSDADASGLIDQTTPINAKAFYDSSYDIGLVQQANVRIAKTGPTSAQAGTTIAYTLSYANDGPGVASDVTVQDTLPAGLSLVSASLAPAAQSGQTLTWSIGQLAPGANGTITVYAAIASGVSGTKTNTAAITTTTPGDDPGDNTATATTTITPPNITDLRITKTGPGTSAPGATIVYALNYFNDGTLPVNATQVVDTLPFNVTFVAASPPPSSVSGQTLTWNLGALAARASGSIQVTAQVAANAYNTSLRNVATITTPPGDPTPTNNRATSTATTPSAASALDLSIYKSAPATVVTGRTATYQLSVEVYAPTYKPLGSSTPYGADNVQVVDTLPPEATFLSASPAPSSVSGQTLSWNLGRVQVSAPPVGAPPEECCTGERTIQVTVRLDAPAERTVTNSASVSTTTPEQTSANNRDTADTTIIFANMRVGKAAQAEVVSGGQIASTLSYGNTASAPAEAAQLSDTLPAGVSFVSASPAPTSVSGQLLTWDLGTLAPGASGSIQLVTLVDRSVPLDSTVTNRADVSTTTPETTTSDNSAQAPTIVRGTNIAVAKTAPATITVGDVITYTVRVTNSSAFPASSVYLTDVALRQQLRDTGYTIVGSQPAISGYVAGGNYAVDDGAPYWQLGDLAPGASATIVLTVRPPVRAAAYTVVNQASATTTTPETTISDNQAQATTRVVVPDLAIIKASTTAFPVLSGQPVRYTLDWRNLATDAAARSGVISDTVPAQLSDVHWRCLSGCAAGGTGAAVRVELGDVLPGAAGQIEVVGTASTRQPRASFTNSATISTTTPEQTLANNRSSVDGEVWTPDVSIVKRATPEVRVGETFTTTLTYRNSGPAPAAGVVLSDTLPAGVTFVSSAPPPSAQQAQSLTWNLGALAANADGSVVLTLRAQPALANGVVLSNRAAISTSDPDRDLLNNQSRADTLVNTLADLAVVKTVTPTAPVIAGSGLLSYTLTVTNNGPATAASVVVTDTPDAALSLVTSDPAPLAGQPLRWELGTLAPGATARIQLVARVAANAPASVRNGVRVGSATPDPNPANNTSSVDSPVTRAADVRISKIASANRVATGSVVTYTLSYLNAGPSVAQRVVVSDDVPDALANVAWSCASGCAASGTGNGIRVDVGTLLVGAGGSIRVSGVATAGAAPQVDVTNTAVITSITPDPNPANNTSTSVTVAQTANLRIAKNGPARATAGALIRYTIAVTNEGPLAADAVQVQDALPPYLTLASADPAPATRSTTSPRWSLGTLAAGQSTRITLDVRVATSAPSGTVLNTATTETTTPERRTDDNTASWPTFIDTPGTTAVTLVYLRAERTPAGVAVAWQTLMEQDTGAFRVLRATSPSAQGAEVGRVESKGSGGGSYRLIDTSAPASSAWYWLVEVERDGTEHTYSPVVSPIPVARSVYTAYLPIVTR